MLNRPQDAQWGTDPCLHPTVVGQAQGHALVSMGVVGTNLLWTLPPRGVAPEGQGGDTGLCPAILEQDGHGDTNRGHPGAHGEGVSPTRGFPQR